MQVSKWGNSLAVRLPKALVDKLNLAEGDEIDLVASAPDKIAVAKIDRRAAFLEAMQQFRWSAPKDYKFDREEANER
jgi:antitoxin MazE